MKDYKMVEGYSLFKQLGADLIGTNYRVGKIIDGKATEHFLFTEVYPFFYKDEDIWKRIELLLNGVKKSKISNLYSPEVVINRDKKSLVYPYMDAVSLEKILEDSMQKSIPINFDLSLSIAMGIADLLDAGSSIAVSGKRSFHGFLTPDNIIIDHDGNIWIKNYGIYAYLNGTDDIHKELEMKYGPWVTPEFIRKEKPSAQSDIYHLGYVIYKMITGNYFSHSEGENFDSKLSNISFLHHIPATDKDFLNNIILFFKKTLNPNPEKRFASIREFKEFISNYFKIEELSSATFNIAYFMSSMYSDETKVTEKEITDELKYIIPSKLKENNKDKSHDSDIVENLLSGLDNRDKSRSKNKFFLIGAILIAVVIGIVIMTSMNSNKGQVVKVENDQANVAEVVVKDMEIEKLKKKLADQQKETALAKLKAEEAENKSQEIEKRIQEEKDAEKKAILRKEQEKQKKIAQDEKKKVDEAKAKEEKIKKEKDLEDEKKKLELQKEEDAKKKLEADKKAVKEGDIVADVDQKPVEIEATIPEFPRKLRKKIEGDSVRAIVSVLIDENGKVKRIRMIKKTGTPEIDIELTRVIYSWKFKPAVKYGKKVKFWLTKAVKVNR